MTLFPGLGPHLDVVLGDLVHDDIGVGVLLPLLWTGEGISHPIAD